MFLTMLLRYSGQARGNQQSRWDASLQTQNLPISFHKCVHLNMLLCNSMCVYKILYFYMFLLKKLEVHILTLRTIRYYIFLSQNASVSLSFANTQTLEHAESLHLRKGTHETKLFSTLLLLIDSFRTCSPFLAELLRFLNQFLDEFNTEMINPLFFMQMVTWQKGESTQTKGKASKIPQLFHCQVTNLHVPANSLLLVPLPTQQAKKTETTRDVVQLDVEKTELCLVLCRQDRGL